MSFLGTLGRVGLGAATLGGSEIAYRNPTVKNWLVGGDATRDFNAATNPQYAGQIAGYAQGQLGGMPGRSLNFGQADQARAQQSQLAGMLQGVAGGTQRGAGEMAVDRQVGQAQAAQQALARMSRGANSALAARQAARSTADIGVAGAGQAAQARMQDASNAQGMLAGLLGQQRAGDFQQQGLGLDQQRANDAAAQGYLAQLMGLDQTQLQRAGMQQQIAMGDQGHLAALLQGLGSIGAAGA